MGAAFETPFSFQEPPVRLCSRSPWNRATPIESCRLGSRFFAGLAVRLGVDRLQEIMREFYRLHAPGLITTAQLEAHVLDRAYDDVIHRAFARWVHRRLDCRCANYLALKFARYLAHEPLRGPVPVTGCLR